MVKLKINGHLIDVNEGLTVLQAAETLGIHIPTLCYHKDLSAYGGCRLCVVEVRGARLPMTSCNLPVATGLIVQTESPALTRYRQAVLRMLLSNFYDAGYTRGNGKPDIDLDSELAHWCRLYQVDLRSEMAPRPFHPVDSDPNPFVWVDKNKCIQCTRCVRACAEIQGRFVWSQSHRGYQARIVAGADATMLASRCESCGACVEYCPTGALANKMSVSAGPADQLVRTTCGYCAVGCQLDLNVKDDTPGGRLLRVTSHKDESLSSVNRRHLCLKGRYGYEYVHHPQRHTRPRVRQYLLDEAPRQRGSRRLVETDWDTALELAARGLSGIRQAYGGASLGLLASGRCLNEEIFLMGKLARQVLGSSNVDCSANLYAASPVEGLVEALGLPAMSGSFEELAAHSGSLLLVGSNLSEQQPVLSARLRQAVLRPRQAGRKLKLVVASPNFTNMAEYAALALYHTPNSEAALVNGLMHILLEKGWAAPFPTQPSQNGQGRGEGWAAFKEIIDRSTPERTAEATGLRVEALYQAAEILADNRPVGLVWSTGLAEAGYGKSNVQALANLARLLDDLDKPGGGVYPLGSQCNSQGAADMGAHPGWLPGYQPVAAAAVRQKFELAWGKALPELPGLNAAQMLQAASAGRIRALYLLGEDLLNTSPQAAAVRQALEACEFVVLQETTASDTTRYADVLLPGVTFAEKTGTFTSAERRVQLVQQAIQPLGQARPDWQIIAELARRIIRLEGQRYQPSYYSVWDYQDSDQILHEIAYLAPVYAGLTQARLAHSAGLFWPAGAAHLEPGAFSAGQLRWSAAEAPV